MMSLKIIDLRSNYHIWFMLYTTKEFDAIYMNILGLITIEKIFSRIMNTLSIYIILCLSSFFNLSRSTPFDSESAFCFYKRWCHTISVVKQCCINNYKNSGKYASLIFVSLYTINIVIPEGLFVFTYRNKKWHDAFISGFHHSLEKDPRGFRNAKTVYTICQLFCFFQQIK